VSGGALRAAGVVLYRLEGGRPRFLLLKTAKDGHWSPPKGHLDRGETDLEGARRETLEETGLADLALDERFREEIHYPVTRRGRRVEKAVVYYLAAAPAAAEPRLSSEHVDLRWATLDEARALLPWPNLREVIERAAARIAALGS
jgi:8-oxo-dGTP pyrophosphatase MutT (NUDIX family)